MSVGVLWHLTFSGFAEKARWALDFKEVPHERREAPFLLHPLWTLRHGGGRTVPLLVFADGEVAPDSTSIVAALERRYPDPPLYPSDPVEREHARALESHFDANLGPDVRRLGFDHLRRHPEELSRMLAPGLQGPPERALRVATLPMRVAMHAYYGVSDSTVERAWQNVEQAIDFFHAELGPEGYLAGDRFSVADLTFAAFLGAIAQPRGFPYRKFPGSRDLRTLLSERGVLEWLEDVYARHRGRWVRP